jgi:uncharacterized surface protein with fasciclin (FAS1) repeats
MPSVGISRGLALATAIAALTLAGCTGNDNEPRAAAVPGLTTAPAPDSASAAAAAPFGPACAGVPASGPGSLSAIADQPVATAAAQSPALSTLAAAVKTAGLADTLNSTQNITVFAPTNEAFGKIPKATLAQVLADKQALTDLLTYHVVEQRRTPADLDTGTLPTLQGSTISTSKAGDTYTANDARIVCGNVQTRNATVYLIDTVLMPSS